MTAIDLVFPTGILFVDGTPIHRWVFDFNVAAYRIELDKVAGALKAMSAKVGAGKV